jgi:hypothetical protein
MYINMNQGSKKFKSGGLHEKHAVAMFAVTESRETIEMCDRE